MKIMGYGKVRPKQYKWMKQFYNIHIINVPQMLSNEKILRKY